MKIDNTGKAVGNYPTQPKTVRGPAKPEEAGKAAADESVSINPVASQMTEPVFNADKVAQIKAAISAGQYKVNPDAIAKGLLDDVQELLRGS